ncbi:MAG: tripartite tricarboxylate transporter TctB family protein [Gammaproteobacteria bacterium]
MKLKMDRDNLLLLVPLTGFALGTLYVGSSYGPVSAFIPFWASIFMLITCLFVLAGLDKQADNDDSGDTGTKANRPGIQSVLSAAVWITAFVAMAYCIGLISAAVAYTFCSMYFFGGKKLSIALGVSLALGLILFGLFEYVLEKELYKGVFIEGFA